MAIRVSFKDINRDLGEKILNETTVTEIKSFVPGMKYQGTSIQVRMFKDIGDDILLPFYYAKQLGFDHSKDRKKNWIQFSNKFLFLGVMREHQNEILQESLGILVKNNAVIIGTPPGSGKTIMASKLWYEIGLLGIVIINRIEIHKGWINTFKKVCPDCIIWITGEKFPDKMPNIIISMDSQVFNIPEEIRMKIGTVIFDEIHLLCTQTRNELFLAFEPKYVIMESATLEMDNGLHKMATLVSGNEGVFRISKVPYNIYVINTGIFGNQEYGKSGMIAASLQKSLAENPERQNMILNIILNNLHRKFMVMYRVKAGIEEFVTKCRDNGIEADSLYGTKKRYKNSKVLVGTVPKMGTGFDEENACSDFYLNPEKSNTMIIVNSIKKWQLYEQVRGRVMRSDNPCIIWLMDDNPSGERHFNGLKKWFKETNGNIIYVNDINFLKIE